MRPQTCLMSHVRVVCRLLLACLRFFPPLRSFSCLSRNIRKAAKYPVVLCSRKETPQLMFCPSLSTLYFQSRKSGCHACPARLSTEFRTFIACLIRIFENALDQRPWAAPAPPLNTRDEGARVLDVLLMTRNTEGIRNETLLRNDQEEPHVFW